MLRLESLQDDPDQKAWDQWVSGERAARKADIAKGLKESGLAAPIPGLVDLVREGTFTDCPPYGKCWEPKEGAYTESVQEEQPAETGGQAVQAERKAEVASEVPESAPEGGKAASAASPSNARYAWVAYSDPDCPFVYSGRQLVIYTDKHPKGVVVKNQKGLTSQQLLVGSGWWATCHAGSWASRARTIPRKHPKPGTPGKPHKPVKGPPPRMHWVVGPKSKGGSFVHVRMGRGLGFIPKHPLDVQGKPPLNAKNGVLLFHQKSGEEVAKIIPAPKNLQIENYRPGGYKATWTKNMPKVERPVIEARLLIRKTGSPRVITRLPGNQKNQVAIRYNYKTRDFVGHPYGVGHGRGSERPVVIAHLAANHGGWGNPSSGNTGR
jgi:hypothetical protein